MLKTEGKTKDFWSPPFAGITLIRFTGFISAAGYKLYEEPEAPRETL